MQGTKEVQEVSDLSSWPMAGSAFLRYFCGIFVESQSLNTYIGILQRRGSSSTSLSGQQRAAEISTAKMVHKLTIGPRADLLELHKTPRNVAGIAIFPI